MRSVANGSAGVGNRGVCNMCVGVIEDGLYKTERRARQELENMESGGGGGDNRRGEEEEELIAELEELRAFRERLREEGKGLREVWAGVKSSLDRVIQSSKDKDTLTLSGLLDAEVGVARFKETVGEVMGGLRSSDLRCLKMRSYTVMSHEYDVRLSGGEVWVNGCRVMLGIFSEEVTGGWREATAAIAMGWREEGGESERWEFRGGTPSAIVGKRGDGRRYIMDGSSESVVAYLSALCELVHCIRSCSTNRRQPPLFIGEDGDRVGNIRGARGIVRGGEKRGMKELGKGIGILLKWIVAQAGQGGR
ncbi:hypothetical protein TrCOL_g10144 [Triparma columacea]|uniref:Uncharacterized protein n=1 Tax=Triparma columacea TaxID=722753 RepID=A0A9W7GA14_9STRA|nr:hypothetical protein TrCOL_g10144 [Triparma columacea]